MNDQFSVPRRAYDFEDYIDIFRRNVAWLAAPVFAGLVLATVVAYLLPDTYVSKAKLRIVPQQIPEQYVAAMTGEQLADHVAALADGILSRETLTSIINNHGLYKKDLKSVPLTDVIEQMRTRDIKIAAAAANDNSSNNNSRSIPMQVTFSYSDPHLAQQVCQDLVSRFMNQSSQDTTVSQAATHAFFSDEYEAAKRDLQDIDKRLSDFRERNAGRLPEEMQMNVSQMNALEGRVTSLGEAATHNTEQKWMLESSLHIAKDRLAAIKDNAPQDEVRDERVKELDQQIRILTTQIANMRDQYREDYPDLQSARQTLAVLQNQRRDALNESTSKSADVHESAAFAKQRMDAQAQVDLIQTQIKANENEAQQISRELTAANAELKMYQARAQGVPAGEKEYSELLNDRELAKQKYDQLESVREKSAISLDMEKRKQGETLEQIESASLPTAPTAPKRFVIIPVGAVVGLVIGAVIVAIREVRNTSLKSLKDARIYTQLSILGSVPLLENDLVVQRRKQIAWVSWATAALAGVLIIAVSVAHYYMSKA